MVKAKFYLNVEGEKLRTLDDLRDNFFIEPIMEHYQSGKLAKWLDVWGYQDELEKVQAIKAADVKSVAAELGRIFDVEVDLDDFKAGISVEEHIEGNKAEAAQAEINERIKAATSEVNMEFFERWLGPKLDDDDIKFINTLKPLMSPLMVAVANGDVFVVKALIQEGADVNALIAPEGYNTFSVLVFAVIGDSSEIVKALIDAGADVNAKDERGWTALMLAKNPESVKALINAGADVNAKDKDGETALMRAENPEIVKALIDAGADVNAKDKDGDTILMRALVLERNPEIVKALIDAGADVNAKKDWGWTALMEAKNPEIVKALIKAGANVNAQNAFGSTALDMAEDETIKSILRAAGGRSGK